MKTNEEIEKLADEYAKCKSSAAVFLDQHKLDFIAGYSACQQESDKRFSESEVEQKIAIEWFAQLPDAVKMYLAKKHGYEGFRNLTEIFKLDIYNKEINNEKSEQLLSDFVDYFKNQNKEIIKSFIKTQQP